MGVLSIRLGWVIRIAYIVLYPLFFSGGKVYIPLSHRHFYLSPLTRTSEQEKIGIQQK